ncbi:MAG: hypothetical protein JSR26_05155 [Proteobacteria bacterium]|nr:hypothetical protein [Pseudomonadota bacterium]
MSRPQSFVRDIERGSRRRDVIELRDMFAHLGRPWLGFLEEFHRAFRREDHPVRKAGLAVRPRIAEGQGPSYVTQWPSPTLAEFNTKISTSPFAPDPISCKD